MFSKITKRGTSMIWRNSEIDLSEEQEEKTIPEPSELNGNRLLLINTNDNLLFLRDNKFKNEKEFRDINTSPYVEVSFLLFTSCLKRNMRDIKKLELSS